MMNCRRATRLLSEAQERELSFSERAGLRLHTAICAGCRNFGAQMKILRRVSRAYTGREEEKDSRDDK